MNCLYCLQQLDDNNNWHVYCHPCQVSYLYGENLQYSQIYFARQIRDKVYVAQISPNRDIKFRITEPQSGQDVIISLANPPNNFNPQTAAQKIKNILTFL